MKNKRIVIAFLIIILYFLPSFFQFNFDKKEKITSWKISLPRIIAGDVPHRMLAIHSLIHDHDFDIKNNLNNVYENNGCDAGYNQKGRILHNSYRNKKTREVHALIIKDLFDKNYPKIFKDPNIEIFVSHPPGLAFSCSLLLCPLKNFCKTGICLIEIACVIFSIIFMLTGIFYLYKTILHYAKNENISLFITACLAFGTPLWHYSSAFQLEAFLTPILVISYYYFIIKENYFIPGVLLAWGSSMRFPMFLVLLIFGFFLLFKKTHISNNNVSKNKIKEIFIFSLPALMVIFLFATYNKTIYGNYIAFPQGHYFETPGNPFVGFLGALFSTNQGLFFFAPILLFSFLNIKNFYRTHKSDAIFMYVLVTIYYLTYTWRGEAWGGGGYSNRYLIPIIPFLGLVTGLWYEKNKNKILKFIFLILLIYSIIINFQAAFFPPLLWAKPFWNVFYIIFVKSDRLKEIIFSSGVR